MINTNDNTATAPIDPISSFVPTLAGPRLMPTRRTGRNDIAPEEMLRELACIVSSEDFPASERNKSVLQYLVESYAQNREEDISAYHIATRIYGRPASFDPIKDPIVRIEIARLRRDLEMYYLKSGQRNSLRLSIPKGRYLPSFVRVPLDASNEAKANTISPFVASVLRASLLALSGQASEAAAAWQDLLLSDHAMLTNLHQTVLNEIGDQQVTQLIIDGALQAGRRA
jgi:hypothetical protein